MKHINIPEPCSEDWNQMTPNERGAFCGKCSQDVYDFTGKSAEEIKTILTLNMANPVCMRIAPKQLDELNADFAAWKIENSRSYQRAWIFTLLVVFGMTLFSCEADEEPVVKEYQRIGQTILNDQKDKRVIDGQSSVDSNGQKQKETHLKTEQKDICTEELVLGKPQIEHEIPQEVIYELDDVIVEKEVLINRIETTAGIPYISEDYNVYLQDINEELLLEPTQIDNLGALIYPNPASTRTTLSVSLPSSALTQIELYSLTGQKIRTIQSGRIRKGDHTFHIDLTELESGIYVIHIQSGKLRETIQFSKI